MFKNCDKVKEKEKNMLSQIIAKNEKRIEKDIKEIEDIRCIDFIDIFPESEEHRK